MNNLLDIIAKDNIKPNPETDDNLKPIHNRAKKEVEEDGKKKNVPADTDLYKPKITVGDTVRVHNKIKEGNKERIQTFEGIVIAKKHGGISETFTVRRLSYGVGVEKVFPIHSPAVEAVELVRRGRVRRAKLYYLRGRVGKAAKVKIKV